MKKSKKAPAKKQVKKAAKKTAKKAGKIVLSSKLLKDFKEILLEKKQEVYRELVSNLDDGKKIDFNEVKDSVDLSTDTYDNEVLHNLSDSEKKMLDEINYALEKIKSKTYGVCESCAKSISLERLKALPFTVHCVDCKSKAETTRTVEQ